MGKIRKQSDLAALPEPCFIQTAPFWLRCFAFGALTCGVAFGVAVVANGLGRDGSISYMLPGALAAVVCVAVLVLGRPLDWRVWINIAATQDGLYLVARKRRVVFVPWRDVLSIGTKQVMSRRGVRDVPLLKLRLPEDRWAAFGNVSSISGKGAVREFLLASIAIEGKQLVAALQAFRLHQG